MNQAHPNDDNNHPTCNIWERYTERVPAESRALLQTVADIATERGITIFLVGGVVRDLFIGNAHLDFDILVEGDGITLAQAVGQTLGGQVVAHAAFHTAKVTLPDGRYLDFAGARTEWYGSPAALPSTEHGTVREDLQRRDFTINAMAMQLNGDEPGRLLDPFDGYCDLDAGIIRVLHAGSFVDDPTRILRAVRFEARFNFRMEEHTAELARNVIKQHLFDHVSGERIQAEFLLLFARRHAEIGVRRLSELGVFIALEPDWQYTDLTAEFSRLDNALDWAMSEPAISAKLLVTPFQRMLLLFLNQSPAAASRLANRLRLPRREKTLAIATSGLAVLLPRLSHSDLPPSALDALLRDVPIALVPLILAHSDHPLVRERTQRYFVGVRIIPALLNGDDLARLSIPRGPMYREILRALRAAQLDGEITTREQAQAMALRMSQEHI